MMFCIIRWYAFVSVLLVAVGRVYGFPGWLLSRRVPSFSHRWQRQDKHTSLCLFMVKKTGKKNTPKRRKTKSSNTSKSKSRQNTETSKAATSQRPAVVLPSSKSHAPPWQVLSKSDADKNVQMEKRRRERMKLGLDDATNELSEGSEERLKSKALLSDANQKLLKWKRFNPSTAPCGISYIGSYLDTRLPPSMGVPEVAFLGRSNVGKSSLLNRLSAAALGCGTQLASDQARAGKTPGATASVNLYAMLGTTKAKGGMAKPILGLVDLPGFGYAKLSKEIKDSVQLAAERYLGKRQELALGILLVDARREPSEDDRAVLAALYDMGVPLVVVATKMDKLGKTEIEPRLRTIRLGLGLPEGQPFSVSSVTGEGTKDLWKIIMEACEGRIEEVRDKFQRADYQDLDVEDIGTIQLDEQGNTLFYADDEDVAYDQGYDWVHNTAVMYERDTTDDFEFDEALESLSNYDEKRDENDVEDPIEVDMASLKLRELRKNARDMQRRGEL